MCTTTHISLSLYTVYSKIRSKSTLYMNKMDLDMVDNINILHRKQRTKRKLTSPRYFPRKVFLSEEKVLNELHQLSLNDCTKQHITQSNKSSTNEFPKPNFVSTDHNGERTFQEIEDSISLEDVDLSDNEVEINPEIEKDLKFQNRKILLRNFRTNISPTPSNRCTQLILWKPPNAVENIMKILSEHGNGKNETVDCNANEVLPIRRVRTRKYAVTDVNIPLPNETAEESWNDSEAFMPQPIMDNKLFLTDNELEEMEF